MGKKNRSLKKIAETLQWQIEVEIWEGTKGTIKDDHDLDSQQVNKVVKYTKDYFAEKGMTWSYDYDGTVSVAGIMSGKPVRVFTLARAWEVDRKNALQASTHRHLARIVKDDGKHHLKSGFKGGTIPTEKYLEGRAIINELSSDIDKFPRSFHNE